MNQESKKKKKRVLFFYNGTICQVMFFHFLCHCLGEFISIFTTSFGAFSNPFILSNFVFVCGQLAFENLCEFSVERLLLIHNIPAYTSYFVESNNRFSDNDVNRNSTSQHSNKMPSNLMTMFCTTNSYLTFSEWFSLFAQSFSVT